MKVMKVMRVDVARGARKALTYITKRQRHH